MANFSLVSQAEISGFHRAICLKGGTAFVIVHESVQKNRQIGKNVLTSLLLPNSDNTMIHLGGYNYAICHTQLIAWEYVQTEQL